MALLTKRLDQYLAKRHNPRIPDLVDEAVEYIFDHPTDFSVGEMANAFGVSRRHLHRLFKASVGVSIKGFQEIVALRTCIDRKLTGRKEKNLTQLAYAANYSDNAYGTVDWLADMTLDTSTSAATWQQPNNFPITEWLEYDDNDSLVTLAVDKQAFDLPRKSGKVKAEYADNTFRIETSRVGALTILISPEMVNMKRPVRVYVNDKLKFKSRVQYDKATMLNRFTATRDREQVWVSALRLTL